MRTFMPLAAVVLRGGLVRGRARFPVLVAAAGELVGDKHPRIPSRVWPPALAGRMAGAALASSALGGAPAMGAAAAAALVGGLASYRVRADLAARGGVADAWWGAAEDVVSISLAAAATAPPRHDEAPAEIEAGSETSPARRRSRLRGAARGGLAGAVGTAAMTAAQAAHRQAFESSPSRLPAEVGRRLIERGLGRRVPRRRIPALNQGMHWFYGTAWGLPYGVLATAGGRRPALEGATLGLGVWAAGLVHLPALGLAAPVWDRSRGELASELGFHLVYGLAAAGAYSSLP